MSSAGPTDPRPSTSAAGESVCQPSSPDAKLTEKHLGRIRRLIEGAKHNKLVEGAQRNKLGAVAVGVDDVAIFFLNLAKDYPWIGDVAKTVKKSAFVPVYLSCSSCHAALRAQTMKGNVEDVKKLGRLPRTSSGSSPAGSTSLATRPATTSRSSTSAHALSFPPNWTSS